MRPISCDFCGEAISADPPVLSTVLRGVPDAPTDSRDFDACLKCAPFILPAIKEFGREVVAARHAAASTVKESPAPWEGNTANQPWHPPAAPAVKPPPPTQVVYVENPAPKYVPPPFWRTGTFWVAIAGVAAGIAAILHATVFR